MKTDMLLVALVAAAAIYSLAWFGLYRALKRGSISLGRPSPTPTETTTPEERARGESSFVILKERQFGISPAGFFTLVGLGYVGLAVAFATALIVISR